MNLFFYWYKCILLLGVSFFHVGRFRYFLGLEKLCGVSIWFLWGFGFFTCWFGWAKTKAWEKTTFLLLRFLITTLAIFLSHFHLILTLHHLINRPWVFNKLRVLLNLLVSLGVLSHNSSPVFSIRLSFSSMSTSSHISRLLDCILAKELIVSFLLDRSSIIGHRLKLSNDSDALGSIQSFVSNLSLEWERFYFGQIEILHFYQLRDFL